MRSNKIIVLLLVLVTTSFGAFGYFQYQESRKLQAQKAEEQKRLAAAREASAILEKNQKERLELKNTLITQFKDILPDLRVGIERKSVEERTDHAQQLLKDFLTKSDHPENKEIDVYLHWALYKTRTSLSAFEASDPDLAKGLVCRQEAEVAIQKAERGNNSPQDVINTDERLKFLSCRQNISEISLSAELYGKSKGQYPDSLETLYKAGGLTRSHCPTSRTYEPYLYELRDNDSFRVTCTGIHRGVVPHYYSETPYSEDWDGANPKDVAEAMDYVRKLQNRSTIESPKPKAKQAVTTAVKQQQHKASSLKNQSFPPNDPFIYGFGNKPAVQQPLEGTIPSSGSYPVKNP